MRCVGRVCAAAEPANATPASAAPIRRFKTIALLPVQRSKTRFANDVFAGINLASAEIASLIDRNDIRIVGRRAAGASGDGQAECERRQRFEERVSGRGHLRKVYTTDAPRTRHSAWTNANRPKAPLPSAADRRRGPEWPTGARARASADRRSLPNERAAPLRPPLRRSSGRRQPAGQA